MVQLQIYDMNDSKLECSAARIGSLRFGKAVEQPVARLSATFRLSSGSIRISLAALLIKPGASHPRCRPLVATLAAEIQLQALPPDCHVSGAHAPPRHGQVSLFVKSRLDSCQAPNCTSRRRSGFCATRMECGMTDIARLWHKAAPSREATRAGASSSKLPAGTDLVRADNETWLQALTFAGRTAGRRIVVQGLARTSKVFRRDAGPDRMRDVAFWEN